MGRFLYGPVGTASLAAVLATPIAGCASNATPLERELNALRDEVVGLRNSQDRLEERLAAIEHGPSSGPSSARSADQHRDRGDQAAKSELGRPELVVVKLKPTESPARESAAQPEVATEKAAPGSDREAQRPLISGEGQRIRADNVGEFAGETNGKAPARKRSQR